MIMTPQGEAGFGLYGNASLRQRTDMTSRTLSQNAVTTVLLGVFGLIMAATTYAFSVDKHFSADGIAYFFLILRSQDFTYIDWARQYANDLSQLLVVPAVKAGVRDVGLLSWLYGASIILPWAASFGISLFVMRHEDRTVIFFMLISMIGINLTTDYILVGEHQVLAVLAWPILFLMIRRSPLSVPEALLLFVLTILFSRLYQTAVAAGSLFFIIALVRTRFAFERRQKVIYMIAGLLHLTVVSIAVYFILHPRSEGNKASFVQHIIASLLTPEAVATLLFALFLSAGWYFRSRALTAMAASIALLYGIYLLWTGYAITSGSSFGCRTLTATLLPLLLLLATVVYLRGIKADRTIIAAFLLYAVVMVGGNVHSTATWAAFKAEMQSVLAREDGYVAFETTPMNHSGRQWGWNNKLLSIAWSKGCVHTIVNNPANYTGWTPPAPPKKCLLKKYYCYALAPCGASKMGME